MPGSVHAGYFTADPRSARSTSPTLRSIRLGLADASSVKVPVTGLVRPQNPVSENALPVTVSFERHTSDNESRWLTPADSGTQTPANAAASGAPSAAGATVGA